MTFCSQYEINEIQKSEIYERQFWRKRSITMTNNFANSDKREISQNRVTETEH